MSVPPLATSTASRPTSVEDLHAMLLAIDRWGRRTGDLRGVFAAAYLMVTRAVLDELARGGFAHPEWVRAIVIDFGERYRHALRGHLGGREVAAFPACWELALCDTRGDGWAAIAALVLGMVAHIHHDLALSLHACGPLDEGKRRDYLHLGDVICRATPAIQLEVIGGYAPELANLHARLQGLDTRLTNRLILDWRARACAVAERMNRDPERALQWRQRLRGESSALALVTLPLPSLARALATILDRARWPTLASRRGVLRPAHQRSTRELAGHDAPKARSFGREP